MLMTFLTIAQTICYANVVQKQVRMDEPAAGRKFWLQHFVR